MEYIELNPDKLNRQRFQDLCLACRTGDLQTVKEIVGTGLNLNQVDEWNYSPLILASLCGFKDLVLYLLENGAVCDPNTFEGERSVYGALNDEIRTILKSYDISKSMQAANSFASYMASLVPSKLTKGEQVFKNSTNTFDFMVKFANNTQLRLHKYILSARSAFFKQKFLNEWRDVSILDFSEIVKCLPEHSKYADSDVYPEFLFVVQNMYLNVNETLFKEDRELISELIKTFELGPDMMRAIEIEEMEVSIKKKSRLRNVVRKKLSTRAMDDFAKAYETHCNVVQIEKAGKELTPEEKFDLINHEGCFFDMIICFELEDGTNVYSPFHRLFLLRSALYADVFDTSMHFTEAQMFKSFYNTETKLSEPKKLLQNPSLVPVVSINIESKETFQVLCKYLYFDFTDIALENSLEFLYLGSYLSLPKLCSASVSAISVFLSEAKDVENVTEVADIETISNIMKAAWATNNESLKQMVTKFLAHRLLEYVESDKFAELVIESASGVKNREKVDSIELVDEIEFYVDHKYTKLDRKAEKDDAELAVLQEINREHRKNLKSLENLMHKLGY